MGNINLKEVFQLAIKIEEDGEAFYKAQADSIPDEQTRKLFIWLAKAERDHKAIFKKIAEKADDIKLMENTPGEFESYLHAYMKDDIFSVETMSHPPTFKNALDAVSFAIDRERESILFYQEIKELLDADHREKLNAIIDEERKHYLQLNQIKQAMRL